MEDLKLVVLDSAESERLKRLEAVVSKNLQAFYDVGCALAEIRSKRLYRETHGTFEEYCNDRFEMTRQHAYRLIDSAQVVEDLSPIGDILPANESHVRPLSTLNSNMRKQVWQRVVSLASEGSKITGRLVSRVAADLVGTKVKEKISRTRSEVATNPVINEEFKTAYESLLNTIASLREAKFKGTSKVDIIKAIDELKAILLEG